MVTGWEGVVRSGETAAVVDGVAVPPPSGGSGAHPDASMTEAPTVMSTPVPKP